MFIYRQETINRLQDSQDWFSLGFSLGAGFQDAISLFIHVAIQSHNLKDSFPQHEATSNRPFFCLLSRIHLHFSSLSSHHTSISTPPSHPIHPPTIYPQFFLHSCVQKFQHFFLVNLSLSYPSFPSFPISFRNLFSIQFV